MKLKKILWNNKLTLALLALVVVMAFVSPPKAISVLTISGSNLKTMMGVIPPIFVLIGLLDVWIPKETMIKHMGDDSGVKGLFFAFLLGSLAAGPLYVAFPVASLLLKKGARFAYVLFFLGTWTAAKIPLLLFEMTSLGVKFTVIHVVSMLTMYLISSFYIEKLLRAEDKQAIMVNLEAM